MRLTLLTTAARGSLLPSHQDMVGLSAAEGSV